MKAAIIGFGVLGKQIKSFLLENTCGDLEFTIFDDTYSLQENISIFPSAGELESKACLELGAWSLKVLKRPLSSKLSALRPKFS